MEETCWPTTRKDQVSTNPWRRPAAGGSYYYHPDGLGSITSLTDGSGQLADSYVYDSFGNLTASTGTITNPFQYTGREFDSETSLYYYRARYYDPMSGRFLSEDPIRLGGGDMNFYAYTYNHPTNFVDPAGTDPLGSGGNQGLAALVSASVSRVESELTNRTAQTFSSRSVCVKPISKTSGSSKHRLRSRLMRVDKLFPNPLIGSARVIRLRGP